MNLENNENICPNCFNELNFYNECDVCLLREKYQLKKEIKSSRRKNTTKKIKYKSLVLKKIFSYAIMKDKYIKEKGRLKKFNLCSQSLIKKYKKKYKILTKKDKIYIQENKKSMI